MSDEWFLRHLAAGVRYLRTFFPCTTRPRAPSWPQANARWLSRLARGPPGQSERGSRPRRGEAQRHRICRAFRRGWLHLVVLRRHWEKISFSRLGLGNGLIVGGHRGPISPAQPSPSARSRPETPGALPSVGQCQSGSQSALGSCCCRAFIRRHALLFLPARGGFEAGGRPRSIDMAVAQQTDGRGRDGGWMAEKSRPPV